MAVCYRHPSRETGVSCSSCGRPICPDCMTPTPVGMRCPECVRDRTRVIRAASFTSNPTVTYALIATCVLVFLVTSAASGGLLNGGNGKLFRDLLLYGPSISINHEYWRIVTGGFLHA